MLNVLVAIEVVKCLAKDMHYRSNHEWFYALHLLADKVDFGSAEDDRRLISSGNEPWFLRVKARSRNLLPSESGKSQRIIRDWL